MYFARNPARGTNIAAVVILQQLQEHDNDYAIQSCSGACAAKITGTDGFVEDAFPCGYIRWVKNR